MFEGCSKFSQPNYDKQEVEFENYFILQRFSSNFLELLKIVFFSYHCTFIRDKTISLNIFYSDLEICRSRRELYQKNKQGGHGIRTSIP